VAARCLDAESKVHQSNENETDELKAFMNRFFSVDAQNAIKDVSQWSSFRKARHKKSWISVSGGMEGDQYDGVVPMSGITPSKDDGPETG
jgi:hypothetical protein